MEVMVTKPARNLGFDFNSARSSPHVSPPSTPKPFGDYYLSAPTSPSHLSQFYRDFDDFFLQAGGVSSVNSTGNVKSGDDFMFDVSGDRETASPSAGELFDNGVIKMLNPPPRLRLPAAARIYENLEKMPTSLSPSQTTTIIQGAFSPRQKKPAAAVSQRGRERDLSQSKSASRRVARSLSPLRETLSPWEEEENEQPHNSSSSSVCANISKGHKKWRLKDFFLFRSASEGRAASKDPLKKHTAALRMRHTSFRGFDGPGSGSGPRRKEPVSAHELHYTVNRAAAEDLKKKTFLPYKRGILGRLAFNPAVHALANGFGFSRK